MADGARRHEAVKKELVGERASSLARATELLEAALRELADAEVALRRRPASRVAAAQRQEALEWSAERLWFLVIQREALGLTRHDILDEVLEIPREVHLAMGPRRRERS